jgi:hypothetical protein
MDFPNTTKQPVRHAELGEVFTPANDNAPLVEERQITNNRDRVLILLALHRRLEQIYPQSREAVDIRSLIDKLSKV